MKTQYVTIALMVAGAVAFTAPTIVVAEMRKPSGKVSACRFRRLWTGNSR